MDFMEAVKEMKKGKKVRRKDIKDYRYLLNGVISLEEEPSMGCTGDDAVTLEEFESVDWEVVKPINPAHICMNCDKHIGFRGFCSKKCHDEWYDKEYSVVKESKQQINMVFGIDIVIDEKIAKGTIAIGYKEGDKIIITNIEHFVSVSLDDRLKILKFIDDEAGKQLTQH